jgi:hypothetical protein
MKTSIFISLSIDIMPKYIHEMQRTNCTIKYRNCFYNYGEHEILLLISGSVLKQLLLDIITVSKRYIDNKYLYDNNKQNIMFPIFTAYI